MSAEMPKHPASVRYAIPEEIASGSGKSWMATRCRSPRRDSRRCASSITGEGAGVADGSVTDGFAVIWGGPSERRARVRERREVRMSDGANPAEHRLLGTPPARYSGQCTASVPSGIDRYATLRLSLVIHNSYLADI